MNTIGVTDDTHLGEYVRALRLRNGWTQTELAQRIGSRQRTISSIEAGTTKQPAMPTLYQLSLVFDVPMYQLVQLTHRYATRDQAELLVADFERRNAEKIAQNQKTERALRAEAHALIDEVPTDLLGHAITALNLVLRRP